jgi:anti-sigma B factor antagonist
MYSSTPHRRPALTLVRETTAVVSPFEGIDPGPNLTVDVDRRVVVITISGELDIGSTAMLAAATAPLGAPRNDPRPGYIVVDLAGVTFLDTSGLGALLDIRTRAAPFGWNIRLIGTRPNVRRVIDLAIRAGWCDPALVASLGSSSAHEHPGPQEL